MSFGKRPSASPPQEPPRTPVAHDPYGRRRVIPAEMWEGQTGAMLRELGFDPNNESNFVPNADSINARIDEQRAAFETKLARVQQQIAAQIPGAQIKPFSLIPDPCWNGAMGHLLMMRLELFPYDDWNIAFLPADQRTAVIMNAPLHPHGDIPAFVDTATKFLAKADAALNAALEEATRTQEFTKFADTRENVRTRVKALAGLFAGQMAEAWQKHAPGMAR